MPRTCIDEKVFVALVVMTMVTILIAGPLMKHYMEKHLKEGNLIPLEK